METACSYHFVRLTPAPLVETTLTLPNNTGRSFKVPLDLTAKCDGIALKPLQTQPTKTIYAGQEYTIGTVATENTVKCLNGNCLFTELDELVDDTTIQASWSRVCIDEIPLRLKNGTPSFVSLVSDQTDITNTCKKGLGGVRKNKILVKPTNNSVS